MHQKRRSRLDMRLHEKTHTPRKSSAEHSAGTAPDSHDTSDLATGDGGKPPRATFPAAGDKPSRQDEKEGRSQRNMRAPSKRPRARTTWRAL